MNDSEISTLDSSDREFAAANSQELASEGGHIREPILRQGLYSRPRTGSMTRLQPFVDLPALSADVKYKYAFVSPSYIDRMARKVDAHPANEFRPTHLRQATSKRKRSISPNSSRSREGSGADVIDTCNTGLNAGLKKASKPVQKRIRLTQSSLSYSGSDKDSPADSSFSAASKPKKGGHRSPANDPYAVSKKVKRKLEESWDWGGMLQWQSSTQQEIVLPKDIMALLQKCKIVNNGHKAQVLCPLLEKFDLTWDTGLLCIRSTT